MTRWLRYTAAADAPGFDPSTPYMPIVGSASPWNKTGALYVYNSIENVIYMGQDAPPQNE